MNEEIFELIGEKKYARLRELLSEMNPADIRGRSRTRAARYLPYIAEGACGRGFC